MKKISITNVLTPFVYVFLLWISYPISIFLGERVIKKIVCKVFVNWDHCYYEFIADISDIDFILFAIPTFIALVIIWFFVLRYFNRKLKEIGAKIGKYFLK